MSYTIFDVSSPFSVCEWFRAQACAALETANRDPITTTYAGLGVVAFDDACGQLTVAPELIFRSETFPVESTEQERCGGDTIAMTIVMTLVRCAPTLDDNGRPPSAARLHAGHQAILDDAAICWNVASMPLPSEEWDRAGVRQSFIGAEGGAIAVETRLTLGIPEREWCTDG